MIERTILTITPSGKVVISWLFSRILVFFILFWLYIGIALTITKVRSPGTMLLALVAYIIIALVYLTFLWRTYSYAVTSEGIYMKGGLLMKKQKFVPMHKITNIESTQNILEQFLGIAKIGIQTAGTGGYPRPEITFEGMEDTDSIKEALYAVLKKR